MFPPINRGNRRPKSQFHSLYAWSAINWLYSKMTRWFRWCAVKLAVKWLIRFFGVFFVPSAQYWCWVINIHGSFLFLRPSPGSGNCPAGGAAPGLGGGDPGRGSGGALGEALVPWCPDRSHHCGLHVGLHSCCMLLYRGWVWLTIVNYINESKINY